MNYYHQPPTIRTYTPFFKYRAIEKAKALMDWADHEYQTALNIAIDKERWGTVKVLADEWSGMRVLSQLEDFRWFCALLAQHEDLWKKLDRKTRKFIEKAYTLYEGLRDVRVN